MVYVDLVGINLLTEVWANQHGRNLSTTHFFKTSWPVCVAFT